MADWVRVQFLGAGPVTVGMETWYPGEVHEAPAGLLTLLMANLGPEVVKRLDGGGELADAAEEAEGSAAVTTVINGKKRAKK